MTKEIQHIVKVLPIHQIKERELFSLAAPFSWGHSRWPDPSIRNNKWGLNSCWDGSIEGLSRTFFQSGIGSKKDLRLRYIGEAVEDIYDWKVGVETGYYFLNSEREYLYSAFARTVHPLDGQIAYIKEPIKQGKPIQAFTFTRTNIAPEKTIINKEYKKVTSFTPLVIDGVESTLSEDPLDLTNVDLTKDEFILIDDNLQLYPKTFSININSDNITNLETYIEDGYYSIELSVDWPLESVDTTITEVTNIYDIYDITLTGNLLSFKLPSTVTNWDELYIGTIKAKPITPLFVYFNKTVNKSYTYEFGVLSREENLIGFTDEFPLLDLSSESIFDRASTTLVITSGSGGETWTRVRNIHDYSEDDCADYTAEEKANIYLNKVYELNSAIGKIYFGSALASLPVNSTATLTGTITPEVIYEPKENKEVFFDYNLNANPLFKHSRGNYLVLDDTIQEPYRITLEIIKADDPTFNLSGYKYVTYQDTDVYLVATVYDKEDNTIQDQLVNFECLNDNLSGRLLPSTAITDALGKAYTRYQAPYLLTDFGQQVDLFNSLTLDDYMLTTYGVGPYTPAEEKEGSANWKAITNTYLDGASKRISGVVNGNKLKILRDNVNLDVGLDNIYLFGRFNNDELQPYNPETKEGGRLVVWYRELSPSNNVLLSPTSYEEIDDEYIYLVFPINVPYDLTSGGSSEYDNLQGYVIIFPLQLSFVATTTDSYGETIISNQKSINVELGSVCKGVWTLPDEINNVWDGSAISVATYMII